MYKNLSTEIIKEKPKTHNLRKVLPLYMKRKKQLLILMLFMFLYGACSLLTPIFTANAIARLAENELDLALKNAILMFGFGILSIIFGIFNDFIYSKLNNLIRYDLTIDIINSINSTKMSKLDSTKLGSLAERLSGDIGTISDSYLDMLNLIFNILTNVIFLIYIAFLNIYMFCVFVVYVVIYYLICSLRSKIWINGRKITRKANDEATSAYYEQIIGIRDVKLLNLKENITNYSNEKNKKAMDLSIKVSKKRILIKYITFLFSTFFQFMFFFVGIILIKKELILLAGLLVVYTYYGRVEGLLSYLSSYKSYSAEGEIAASRIFEVIEDFEKEDYGDEELENFMGKVEFKDVKFKYDTNYVLNGVNLSFEPGKMTAIVGKSGSGKTTILNLITKLYDLTEGEVLLDEVNINRLTENCIRSCIGEVSQAPYIFNATIRQNLLFSKPDATDEELIAVLKKAQIYNDINKMEMGLDTEIGENGIKLSGGQKQRLAIARLLLKDNKVIILDEATSALDNERQNKIVEILDKQKKNKTIVIVAHRLSTIIGADKIYMIDDGNVIASGTHSELMNSCQSYHDLYVLEESSATDNNEIE